MLYGLMLTLFVFVCLLLILIVLIQQGKSSMGLGNLGGSTQMLFGGSGGQDIFQKTTWVLGIIFIFGSLVLSLMKTHAGRSSRYMNQPISSQATFPMQRQAASEEPISEPAQESQEQQ